MSMKINDKLNQDVYSTSEIKTNKIWIDNKPIYRKVIVGTTPLPAPAPSLAHNISNIGDYRSYADVRFVHKHNGNSYTNTIASSSAFISTDAITSSTITFNVADNWNEVFIPIITLEYTKTN